MELSELSDQSELSDAEFMRWAGFDSLRWAALPPERRESWIDHLLARLTTTSDDDECNSLWRLAYVIVQAEHAVPRVVDQRRELQQGPLVQ